MCTGETVTGCCFGEGVGRQLKLLYSTAAQNIRKPRLASPPHPQCVQRLTGIVPRRTFKGTCCDTKCGSAVPGKKVKSLTSPCLIQLSGSCGSSFPVLHEGPTQHQQHPDLLYQILKSESTYFASCFQFCSLSHFLRKRSCDFFKVTRSTWNSHAVEFTVIIVLISLILNIAFFLLFFTQIDSFDLQCICFQVVIFCFQGTCIIHYY